jgi:hypothetical protein
MSRPARIPDRGDVLPSAEAQLGIDAPPRMRPRGRDGGSIEMEQGGLGHGELRRVEGGSGYGNERCSGAGGVALPGSRSEGAS